jgi:hypothetical protein
MTKRLPPEFSLDTVAALAQRAGYKCSFPGCRRPTGGPSSETEAATSSTGMACHIVPRSNRKPARRVDLDFTDEMKAHISNGIWMCFTHGKLIDTDEVKYAAETLRCWRDTAVKLAEFEHSHGRSPTNVELKALELGLAEVSVSLRLSELPPNVAVAEALINAGVELVWGRELTDAVRDLCIEVIRNAYQHNGSSEVKLTAAGRSVRVEYDGSVYDIWQLIREPRRRQGAASLDYLASKFADVVTISSESCSNGGAFEIALLDDVVCGSFNAPCTLRMSLADFWGSWLEESPETLDERLARLTGCQSVVIVLPSFLAGSDLALVSMRCSPLAELRDQGCRITVVAPGASSRVLEQLRLQLRDVTVLGAEANPKPKLAGINQ